MMHITDIWYFSSVSSMAHYKSYMHCTWSVIRILLLHHMNWTSVTMTEGAYIKSMENMKDEQWRYEYLWSMVCLFSMFNINALFNCTLDDRLSWLFIYIYIHPAVGHFLRISKYFHSLRSFFIPFCKLVWWSPSFDPSHDSPVIISPSLLLLLCSVLKLLFKKSVVSTVEWDDGRTIFNSVVCICLNILVFLYLFDFLYSVFTRTSGPK